MYTNEEAKTSYDRAAGAPTKNGTLRTQHLNRMLPWALAASWLLHIAAFIMIIIAFCNKKWAAWNYSCTICPGECYTYVGLFEGRAKIDAIGQCFSTHRSLDCSDLGLSEQHCNEYMYSRHGAILALAIVCSDALVRMFLTATVFWVGIGITKLTLAAACVVGDMIIAISCFVTVAEFHKMMKDGAFNIGDFHDGYCWRIFLAAGICMFVCGLLAIWICQLLQDPEVENHAVVKGPPTAVSQPYPHTTGVNGV